MRVATAAVGALDHADIVSTTVLTWPEARTTASTDNRADDLDDAQCAHGRGPCLEAAWEGTPIRAVIDDERSRWPEFTAAATELGVRTSLSVPLLVDRVEPIQESVGSLNIYRFAAEAFDPFDEALMSVYTVSAGQAITNARRWQHARETVSQLENSTDLAHVYRHGQGSTDGAARLRPGRRIRQTQNRIATAQRQAAHRCPRIACLRVQTVVVGVDHMSGTPRSTTTRSARR